jgi:maltose alpha-D-glucosyltransferase/alpha-amylase
MAENKKIDAREPDPLWFKDAIIYQLHVKAFRDSNDDGVGDFLGLIEKLDYIADLGVNVIWLLPFYPSPMRDDGYDIADYRRIYPPYGSRRDCRRFIREAHRRGLRVITELVINHTSDQHPWFQAARHAPKRSAKRNFYVWSDTDDKYAGTRIIFTDTETSNWAWDPVAQQYYWHRFFSHQPDLNFANPSVIKAVIRVMCFWFDMGVDGMRLDAIPYLCEREGTNSENLPETHEVLKHMRTVVDERYSDRMFLAEANQWPEDVLEYFGDGDECHMAYHFPLMPRMYMAIAQEDRHPIIEILEQTPAIPETCQWAIFLRNHDELTLEMVTETERDYMYETYARDPRARINVGIRRRLAPLMDNDVGRIKLLKSLLMSMPGSPILYYGDELGMGDNIFLGDRNGVRTPMQWSPDRNAGFSRADPQQLYLPPIMDPIYGYEAVNVEAQARDASSLLNWTRRLIGVRKSSPAFGRGTLTMLAPGNRRILAYLREYEGEIVLCVANLSGTAQPVELDLSRFRGRVPVDMLGRSPFPPIGELPYLLTLVGHGFFWFRLTSEADVPEWHVEALPRTDLITLVMSDGWDSFFPERLRRERRHMATSIVARLTQQALPAFLQARRWFAAKTADISSIEITRRAVYETGLASYLLVWLQVQTTADSTQDYFLLLASAWGSEQDDHVRELLPHSVARVRERARLGVLYEAFHDRNFCLSLLEACRDGRDVQLDGGQLKFTATRTGAEILRRLEPDAELRLPPGETSNSIVFVGEQVFLKFYRRLSTGPNPELEIGRFLTEHTDFRHFPRLVGALEYRDNETAEVLMLAQEYQRSQGDGWGYFLHYLERFLDEANLRPAETTLATLDQAHAQNDALLQTLGRRTGELHVALTTRTGDPNFEPEAVTESDLDAWVARVRRDAEQSLEQLEAAAPRLPEAVREPALDLVARRDELLERIANSRPARAFGLRTRYHGDFHLGQVLLAENDFVITDFEGEPARPIAERRRKHSPLRDVAGMLRSFDYAVRSAMRRLSELPIGDPEVFRTFALDWEARASRAFLNGYAAATEARGLYGPTLADAMPLVKLFVMEKALYELRYELENRPDWIELPLTGLLHLLEQPGEFGSAGAP